VVTGSALSLLRFAQLSLDAAPLALVSGAVQLTPAIHAVIEQRFAATVLDLYGLKETGPIAVAPERAAHVVVPRRIHLEVVDPAGRAVPDGTRRELTVTVDGNPFLPLMRYRTGDTGVLGWGGGRRTITDLGSRASVVFRSADGRAVPSVDLTQQLQHPRRLRVVTPSAGGREGRGPGVRRRPGRLGSRPARHAR